MDICRPMPVEFVRGSRYILLIVDDYSGMYFTYFFSNIKVTVFLHLKYFKKM